MFEFTEDEYKEICKKAMLNDEMCKIFEMVIKGYSRVEIFFCDYFLTLL